MASESCVAFIESRAPVTADASWMPDEVVDPTFCAHSSSPTSIRNMFRYAIVRQVLSRTIMCPLTSVLSESCISQPPRAAAQPTTPDMYMDDAMRSVAVSWLVEQASQFGLCQATLFLAVTLLDKFRAASDSPIPSNFVTLLCTTCMFIAAKMEGVRIAASL